MKLRYVEKGQPITSISDIMALDIVDWNRLNGCWRNPAEALETIGSHLVNTSLYSIVEMDLYEAPKRDDFPGWEHPGLHVEMAEMYWNWFRTAHPYADITFSDSPDFYGVMRTSPDEKNAPMFWGDFGKVSVSAFGLTVKNMSAHDLWISVVDPGRQIIIEPQINIVDMVQFRID